jgi:hypothetical protein
MRTYTFPADGFVIQDDHEAVHESGSAYGRFTTLAGEAAVRLRGLDSGAWVGSEGDLFRARVAELPPHLDSAQGAFSQVAGALGGFAEVLAAAQQQMAGVRADAEQAFRSLADAGAQHNQLRPPDAEQVQIDPQAQTAYDQLRRDLDNRIGRLGGDIDGQLAVAAGVAGKLAARGLERLAPQSCSGGWTRRMRPATPSGWPTPGRRSPASPPRPSGTMRSASATTSRQTPRVTRPGVRARMVGRAGTRPRMPRSSRPSPRPTTRSPSPSCCAPTAWSSSAVTPSTPAVRRS